MSIERLTTAARAAGFAMALNDDPVPAPVTSAASKPETRPGLMVSSWASPWKLWATGTAPRIGA